MAFGIVLGMKLAVAITFFFDESRLRYLEKVLTSYEALGLPSKIFVVTTANHEFELERIRELAGSLDCSVVVPAFLGHPYLLTWCHREIFKSLILGEEGFTHFLYSEDDLFFTKENLDYWLESRRCLSSTSFIPGFVRYEVNSEFVHVSTDITSTHDLSRIPRLEESGYQFVGLRQPYQGMYLLDLSMAEEMLFSAAGSPDFGKWGIREKAAQGLTFWQVPKGFYSRMLVRLTGDNDLDPGCLIHHMPNNYACNSESKFGKLPLSQVLG